MTTHVFGIRVTIDDYQSIVAEDTSIGLYNVESDLASNAASAQKDITVNDATYFREGTKIKISDDTPQNEIGVIESIVGNVITLKNNLTNTYTTTQNAKLESSSEFRWLYNSVSGVSNWNTDMLQEKGLSKVIKSAPIDQGGCVAAIGGITIKLKNTQQFFKELDDLGISLLGKRVEQLYFEDITENVIFDGNCNNISPWSKANYSFSATKPRNKRNALMSRELNTKDDNLDEGSQQIGKMVPITFGKWNDKPVKFIRNADEQKDYENIDTQILNETEGYYASFNNTYEGINTFPIVDDDGAIPPEMYKIKIAGVSGHVGWYEVGVPGAKTTGIISLPYFVGKYIYVVKGTGGGLFREITSAQVDLDADGGDAKHIIELTIESIFPEILDGNATATATNQSWIKISLVDRKYIGDLRKCKAYLDNEGNEITQGLNLYGYSSEKKVKVSGDAEIVPVEEKTFNYLQLPQYSYEDAGSGNNNEIDIDVMQFNNNIDTIDSFLILPIKDVILCPDPDLSFWGLTGYNRLVDGAFWKKSGSTYSKVKLTSSAVTGTLATDTIDKNRNTYWQKQFFFDARDAFWRHVIEFKLPDVPKDFGDEFDLYILIRTYSGWKKRLTGNENSFYNIRYKFFMGDTTLILDKNDFKDDVDDPIVNNMKLIDNTPDFYWEAGAPALKNKQFFYNNDTTTTLSGYINFHAAEITNRDLYNAMKNFCCFQMRREWSTDVTLNFEDILRIYEMAVMLKKQISIKESVYTFFKGRIFNDTFGSRKTSANLIESPGSLLEAVCRSEDWSDRGIMPAAGWGKAYSESALIKTTGTGSFDSTELNEVNAFKCARQIHVKTKMYTEKIKETICRNFFLLNYQDANGYECVVPLEKSLTSPTNIVTLADIRLVNGNVKVSPADSSNIYPEPFVRYFKDLGSNEFDGYIGVTNVNAENPTDDEKASYVIGNMTEGESIALYDLCASNYSISGIITKPPSNMTDLLYANGNLVNAEAIAKWYIFKWVNWMGLKKVSFPVHFLHTSSGVNTRNWNAGQKFLLQLPHETNNVQIECLCSRHVIDPNPPYHIQIEAFMIDSAASEFFIQEVMHTATEGADLDVQETMNISDTNIQEVT